MKLIEPPIKIQPQIVDFWLSCAVRNISVCIDAVCDFAYCLLFSGYWRYATHFVGAQCLFRFDAIFVFLITPFLVLARSLFT